MSYRNGPFPWNMLITFTHEYRPCWLANTIELCTKRVQNSAMFPQFAKQNLSAHTLCTIYIFHGKGLLPPSPKSTPTRQLWKTPYIVYLAQHAVFGVWSGSLYSSFMHVLYCTVLSCCIPLDHTIQTLYNLTTQAWDTSWHTFKLSHMHIPWGSWRMFHISFNCISWLVKVIAVSPA